MARPRTFINEAQRALMEAACRSGDLVFSTGGSIISAKLVGTFSIRRYGEEDRLDVGDGTDHVLIDWNLLDHAEIGTARGEGLLTFWNETDLLFELFRPAGPFPQEVEALVGELMDPS